MNETIAIPKPRPKHPIWRGLFCLLLGILAWWGVYRWLSPKPRWTKLPTEYGTVYWPLTEEDETGKYLVAWESSVNPGPMLKKEPSLAVIDQPTGQVLFQIPHQQDERPMDDYIPRVIKQRLWRLVPSASNVDHSLELRSWLFQTDTKEKLEHLWQCPAWMDVSAEWSENKQILLVRYQFAPLHVMEFAHPLLVGKWCLQTLQRELTPSFSWYETWKIPSSANESASMLARWTVHPSRHDEVIGLSPDGRWGAVAEHQCDKTQLLRAVGDRQELQGLALLRIFMAPPYGTLIYDTATGKEIHRFESSDLIHWLVSWYRQALIVNGRVARTDQKVEVAKLLQEPKLMSNEFYNLSTECCAMVQWQDMHFEPIHWPESLNGKQVELQVNNKVLIGSERLDDHFSNLYCFEIVDRRLIVTNQIMHVYGVGTTSCWIAGDTKQIIVRPPLENTLYRGLREWSERWPWLQRCLALLPDAHVYQTKVYDSSSGYERTHLMDGQCCNIRLPDMKHLYLMTSQENSDGEETSLSLEAYDLPLKLFSPWWGRSVGLAVLLFTWFLLTYWHRLKLGFTSFRAR